MLRLLLLIAFLALPFGTIKDTSATSFADAQRLAPLVKERFKLFVPVSHCGFTDNQFAFNFALDKFRGTDRETLHKASYDGWAAGDALADGAPCPVAIDRLKTADDKLLAQSEVLPDP